MSTPIRILGIALSVLCSLTVAVSAFAQAPQMPDPKLISGVPLPVADEPIGTVSVRIIRGDFDNPVPNVPVEFSVDGKARTITADPGGRAVIEGLKPGTKVKAFVTLDGKRIESQDIVIANSGIRVVLVGVDPDAEKKAEAARKLAEGPAVKGIVVFGPESQIVAELTDDRLNVYYMLQILNTARTPVDIGGPIILDLPSEARGASLLDPAPKGATVTGAHLTMTGPFPPGATSLQVAYEMPFDSGSVLIEQKYPIALQTVTVLTPQAGGIGLHSPQLTSQQAVQTQGGPAILAGGPGLAAGQTLAFEITGLPHHATWPRDVALALAGIIIGVGIWAAVTPGAGRRAA